VVRAGTFNSGLHNKPAGCGAAEAYTSGTGSEEVNDFRFLWVYIYVYMYVCNVLVRLKILLLRSDTTEN
jgi:hypothetical protein